MVKAFDKQDPDKPDFMNDSYLRMLRGWVIMQDLWGGTLEVRDKGRKYLPQFNKEPAAKYQQRLEQSVFYNNVSKTISTFTGMVFKNNIAPEDAPEPIKELFTDIDLCGTDLAMFLRETFTNAVRDGHSFIFVDAPPMFSDDARPTLADVANRRPYWINYQAHQILNWDFETINERAVLSQVTFKTVTTEKAGKFGQREVVRFKALFRGTEGKTGTYQNYKYNDKNELVADGEPMPASWTEIPLAVCYGRKVSPMESAPPLMELANLNILHYRKTSDFDDVCHRICVPILKRKLDTKEDLQEIVKLEKTMTVSAAVMMNLFGEHADLSYVEVTGAGLEIAHNRIKEIEAQMSKMGLEMLAPTVTETAKTATEVHSDNAHAQSDLAVMARNLETCAEIAFYFTAESFNQIRRKDTVNLDKAEDSKLKLKIDYDKLTFSIEQLKFFDSLVDKRKLSLQTFLEFLPQVAEMPKNFTPKEELRRLRSEASDNSDLVGNLLGKTFDAGKGLEN